MRRCLFLLAFAILLVACRAESILPPTPTPGLAEATPESVPASTPTMGPIAPTGAWRFRNPRNTSNPALIEKEDGFALDLEWEIETIEYVYQWWGLAPEPILETQILQKSGELFLRNDETTFSSAGVLDFQESIVRFQHIQAIIAGNAWTDDYPSHTIQITGKDGQQLLLVSTSTGNPGDGPWNLIYNDQLFAQYDGTFGYTLPTLFVSQRGEPGAVFMPGEGGENEVHFSTGGVPRQLEFGFDGLLPLADSFVYHANLATQSIKGSLVGRSSIGGFGNMVIGTFPSLESITLATPDLVTCSTEMVDMNDAVGAAWTFTCPIPSAQANTAYLYPITIVLQNDKGVPTTLTGNLSGVWSETTLPLRLPLPPFLQTALEQNSDAAALLETHEYVFTGYSATLSATPPHDVINVYGDVTFLGRTTFEGQSVRYQVTTPFALTKNEALEWKLSPEALQQLIADTLKLPETQTLLRHYPDTILHLGYLAPIEREFRYMDNYYGAMSFIYPAWCGTEPTIEENMDASPMLVRAVGYLLNEGQTTVYGAIDEDGKFRPSEANLQLGEDAPALYFPTIADPLTEGYVSLQRFDGWNSLSFGFDPADVTPERIARFEAIAESLGAELNSSDGTPEEHPEWWIGKAFSLAVSVRGDFELVACE